ncbi:MAG: Hsp20/alpha crystallin family protein [Patescibacteria group bacterium]|nr:Hsp20/alpha crystallin family protein [Patescibacteria group bacterium]
MKKEKKIKTTKKWLSSDKDKNMEGEMIIDVYETDEDIVIQSTIAGVMAEDLDISIDKDMVTIKGHRQRTETDKEKKYLYEECYWGPFSRQVILPEEVNENKSEAVVENGVLSLKMPKIKKIQKKKIKIKDI